MEWIAHFTSAAAVRFFRMWKRLKYEGCGPWPVAKIMSCLFQGAGVRETLGRIRWMFLPVKSVFHSSCQRRRLEFFMILLRRLLGAGYCRENPADVACLAKASAALLPLWPTCALIHPS
ncbi:hypothetical protein AVEN_135199-1 [Araneus ventricosus]|uniref:Uncharacterized protein n=1 Tax=Araneus ventricosus TaxID=182803 RepID=A0A4Y2PD55_ARAVE|nr:hypothetical protein AVEN_135199-1 [Araneus ventricosus]